MVTVTKPANSAAFKAFVDASAGAMGSLFAAVLLYPLDVVKTRQQVAVTDKKDAMATPTERADEQQHHHHKKPPGNMFALCWAIYRAEGLDGLFAGLSSKMAHTLIASFAYFYWYSFLKSAAEKRSGKTISTGMNLLVAALAGALNMSMTLPLEMINTRAQITANESDSDSEDSDDADTKKQDTPKKAHKGMLELSQEIYAEGGLLSFWKGYVPSLVLVSNPSINFTVFDKLKLHMQQWKTVRTGGDIAKRLAKLTMFEAFVIAAIAKATATILTYPIIRAKVLMQAQKKQVESSAPPQQNGHHHHHHHHERPSLGNSMAEVLVNIGAREGPSGYFRGCSAQLFNTVLKSALLLMTKEQIYTTTMRLLYALRRNRVASAAATAVTAKA